MTGINGLVLPRNEDETQSHVNAFDENMSHNDLTRSIDPRK
jgi:hypothetical protein